MDKWCQFSGRGVVKYHNDFYNLFLLWQERYQLFCLPVLAFVFEKNMNIFFFEIKLVNLFALFWVSPKN